MIIETIEYFDCNYSPLDLNHLRPDYSKDPDFEGYLYLYDAEIIEEEIQFEEMLMKRVEVS